MNESQDDEHTVLASGGRAAALAGTISSESGDTVLPVGTRLGEFEIVGLLGVGGFGIVYRAHDCSLGRDVALKEYMPSALASRSQANVHVNSARHADMFQAGLRSFVNEARMLAHFDHPALVKVYRFWEANGTAYMVMPCYQGVTLKDAMKARTGPPEEAWLRQLMAQLLDALALIHAQQCFHRDIAPDNILMLDDARPLLLDFGAARRAIEGMTQAFTVILKQGYAPLEQYAEVPGMRQGAWTDLYALAAVVHYAIDGRPPPPAVGRIIADPYVPLAQRYGDRYSAAFLAAIDAALAVKAEQRPQDVAGMRALLGLHDSASGAQRSQDSVLRTAPLPPAPAAVTAAVAPPRSRAAVYAGIAVFVTAAAGLGYWTVGSDKPLVVPIPTAPLPPAKPAQPPTRPQPTPVAVFEPVAALDAIVAGASTERSAVVEVENARVRIGHDSLRLSVRASHAGYVYLYMVGSDRNNFWLLFPNAIDRNNAIGAGQTMQLPGTQPGTGRWRLEAGGPAGTDHLVVMVSDTPRRFDAAGLTASELFSEFPIARAAQLQRAHTGKAPLFAGAPACTGTACSHAYAATAFAIEEVAP
ncbi:serine/threonine protein kinase [Pseudoduganella chitinolytica]|uniref:Serine/threonine-protein kinase n=1 Tax=Pseudoduganella chitinolytica TaxID=34070 RepID=A0ABY8BIW2_9BURK|nr:serine/threonine-protein kinase [Pseudoduganella chitinolytica]WEF34209.1 serine/threonine-protein kinase [Pseudoduganella chitinolytica]